jgi:hypothetical protein
MAVGLGHSSTFSASRALAEFDGSQVSKSDCPGLPVVKPFILSGPVGQRVSPLATFGSD